MGGWGGGGGGGTLIFSYIRRLWLFFIIFFFFWGGGGGGVQNIEFQYFCGFSEDFVDIFWGSSQNWTVFRGHFYAF